MNEWIVVVVVVSVTLKRISNSSSRSIFTFYFWQGFIKSTLPLLFTLAGMKREQGSN